MLHLRSRAALLVCGSFFAGAGAVVFLACTGDDPVLTPSDAGGDAGDVVLDDAGPDVADRPCDPAKKFDPPVVVTGLANPDIAEMNARFTSSETTAFFSNYGVDGGIIVGAPDAGDGAYSFETFYGDIYAISRASIATPFGSAQLVTSLSGPTVESSPTVTGDGKTIYFTRYGGTSNSGRIWTAAVRSGIDFFDPAPVDGTLNDAGSQENPYVVLDGSALYFKSTRNKVDGYYRAASVNGKLSDAQPVPGITAKQGDYLGPVAVSPDELTIYWSLSSQGATAGSDMFVATRPDTSSPFSGKRALTELNTALDELPSYLSADGCRLYYMSSQVTTTPNFVFHSDIYVATKPK